MFAFDAADRQLPAQKIPLSRGELRRRVESPGARRTALVTGATGSIGRTVSTRLAGMVDTLLVHGRNPQLLWTLATTLAPANPGTSIVPVPADLSSLADVRRLTRRVGETFGHLDILVNNAATAGQHGRTTTTDGHELVFQVNYLSPVLLTAGMFDMLRASKNGRVVNVVCDIYKHAKIADLSSSTESRYHPLSAYAQSKFALAAHTAALFSALSRRRCSALCVDPGIVDTKLRKISLQPAEVTVSEAADNVLYGITAPRDPRGFYIQGKKLVQPVPEMLRISLQRQLVTTTEELLGMPLPWTADCTTNGSGG